MITEAELKAYAVDIPNDIQEFMTVHPKGLLELLEMSDSQRKAMFAKRRVNFSKDWGHVTSGGTSVQLKKSPFKLSAGQVKELSTAGTPLRKGIAKAISAARKDAGLKITAEKDKFSKLGISSPDFQWKIGRSVGKFESSFERVFEKGRVKRKSGPVRSSVKV